MDLPFFNIFLRSLAWKFNFCCFSQQVLVFSLQLSAKQSSHPSTQRQEVNTKQEQICMKETFLGFDSHDDETLFWTQNDESAFHVGATGQFSDTKQRFETISSMDGFQPSADEQCSCDVGTTALYMFVSVIHSAHSESKQNFCLQETFFLPRGSLWVM